jgi:hypothetical protein
MVSTAVPFVSRSEFRGVRVLHAAMPDFAHDPLVTVTGTIIAVPVPAFSATLECLSTQSSVQAACYTE